MIANAGHALLIGVDDYSAFDKSVGNEAGTSDLPGSRNDVVALWRICRDVFRIPAENIRVLASPAIELDRLPGALPGQVNAATRQQILDQSKWLAQMIKDGSDGLLLFSGHGDQVEGDGLSICPTDVKGANLHHAVAYTEIEDIFKTHNAAERLTFVIDACHSGGAAGPSSSRAAKDQNLRLTSLTARPLAAHVKQAAKLGMGANDRVLAAAAIGEVAYQARFNGEFRGAFTWALGSAIEQWQTVQETPGYRLDISYGELLNRTTALLKALSFPQTPVLDGPANVKDLAFLQWSQTPEPTVKEPTARRYRVQVDPGGAKWRQFALTCNGTDVGIVFAIGRDDVGDFSAYTEYWYVNPSGVAQLGSNALSVSYSDHNSGEPSPPSYSDMQEFQVAENITWDRMISDPSSGGALYRGTAVGGTEMFLRINSASSKVTVLTWYQNRASGVDPANLAPTGTFNSVSSVTGSVTWVIRNQV